MTLSPLLTLTGLCKSFTGNEVIKNISLDIHRGEIVALLGENGAGKSTLLKMMCGILIPSAGSIHMEGKTIHLKSPHEAKALGISMIPQEYNLIPELSVYENIFLGSERKKGWFLDKKAMIQRSQELLMELHRHISPNLLVQHLSVAQKQMVEVAKALVFDVKLLILDEPTTVLTEGEVAILFTLIRKLRDTGVTILFISHKLKEVKNLCDRVIILRDGELISENNCQEISEEQIAQTMVGRELNKIFPRVNAYQQEVIFEVKNLCSKALLQDIAFSLHRGEILGIAGMTGSGRSELAESLVGLRPILSGKLTLQGKPISVKNPLEALAHKLVYLSEDRQGKGLIMNFNSAENINLSPLHKCGSWLLNKKKERSISEHYFQKLSIRAADHNADLQHFSGGNQQKVYLAKLLECKPQVLILDEPTRGIDVNAKSEFYHFIQQLAHSGVAIILISSEMEEVIGLSHRVLVMREGQICGELTDKDISKEEIMYYASGIKEAG